eukprot:1178763-Alexandrium_andersonii.AAC.1
MRQGGLRLSPVRSCGGGRLAPLGALGPQPPAGWTLGPELTLTRHLNDRLGVSTCEAQRRTDKDIDLETIQPSSSSTRFRPMSTAGAPRCSKE